MTTQEHAHHSTHVREEPESTEEPAVDPEKADREQKLKDNLDAVLDEIDEVLEANAEEFVRSYVQKGGQ